MREQSFTNIFGEPISDVFSAPIIIKPAEIFQPSKKTILERIAESERSAFGECLECYGNYIWTLAKRCCTDADETEKCVQAIFRDIWKNAARFDAQKTDEKTFIAILSLRRLMNKTNEQGSL